MKKLNRITLKVTVITIFAMSLISSGLSESSPTICVESQSNNTSSCRALDEALLTLRSNSLLLLEEGTHIVQSDYLVSGKVNVSIVGNPAAPSRVVIRCNDTYGLIFMGIQQLRMSGFTVTDCGFTGIDRVLSLFSSINNVARLFFNPLYLFSTGVLLFDIRDFVMEDTIIKENEGFGMVAINLVGDSKLTRVDFISNFPNARSVCNLKVTTAPGGSGGGLFLTYHDYINESRNDQAENTSLLIDGGMIQNNYNCRRSPITTLYNRLARSLTTIFFTNRTLLGSGGVTVSLGQSSYSVNVKFNNCSFMNNSGLSHNTALMVLLYNETQESEVIIQNSDFQRNGGLFYESTSSFPENGLDPFGALALVFFVPLPPRNVSNSNFFRQLQNPTKVFIMNCSFVKNTALSGAGITFISFTSTSQFVTNMLRIQDCIFQSNTGNFGSAIFMTELSYSAFESNQNIIIDSITVQNNHPFSRSSNLAQSSLIDTISAVDIRNIRVRFTGNSNFIQNAMSAVSTSNAILEISGVAQFTENSGVTGGALHLESESYLVLVNQTQLVFTRNSAVVSGGALYVNFQNVREFFFDCFLFMEEIDVYCNVLGTCPKPNNRYIIKFINNIAPLGSSVFGSNLFDCPWNENGFNFLNATEFTNNISSLDPSRLPILNYDLISDGQRTVNTMAMAITGIEAVEDGSLPLSYVVEPGEHFLVPLSAIDRLAEPVPLTIFSLINDTQAFSIIGESNTFLLASGEKSFTNVPLQVFGLAGNIYSVTFTTNDAPILSEFTILVALKNCSIGFNYNATSKDCECEIHLFLPDAICYSNGLISVPGNEWVGIDSKGHYIRGKCIRDFCLPVINAVNLSDPDSQCADNRSGVMCGGCREGFSRLIGTNACGVCDSYWNLFYILLFAVLGILLFAYLAVFNVTITDGYLNGFIFYSNIIDVYFTFYVPSYTLPGYNVPVGIISFLNLNFGIPVCFYPGMTQLALIYLTLVFPVYLTLILLTVVLCGKFISNQVAAKFFQKINVTHVFATLILISYTSFISTCFITLSSVSVGGAAETSLRWEEDPNVPYIAGLHISLVCVSILCLVILMPIPLLLLFPKFIFRTPVLRKFKPLVDAFIAPLAPKKEFWVGLRILFRLVFLIFSIILSFDPRASIVLQAVLIAVLTVAEFRVQPFNGRMKNFISQCLMVNLTLGFSVTAISALSFNEQVAIVLLVIDLYVFLMMFLLLNLHYLLIRFKRTRDPYYKATEYLKEKCIQAFFKVCRRKKRDKRKNDTTVTIKPTGHTTTDIQLPQDNFEETDFIPYREGLLETESLSDRVKSDIDTAAKQTT